MNALGRGRKSGSAKFLRLIGLLSLLCLALPDGTRADTFDWNYTSPDVTASGQLTTDPTGLAGLLQMTSISGTVNGVMITGIDNNIHDADNLILYPSGLAFPAIDSFIGEGIGFDLANGNVGKFFFAFGFGYGESIFDPNTLTSIFFSFDEGAAFTLAPSNPSTTVPEPSVIWLLVAGVAALYGASRRRTRIETRLCQFGRWILAVGLIVSIGAFPAKADSFTPSFACQSSCESMPTAADVSFPSPSISETWDNISVSVELAPGDNPSDTYTWNNSLLPGLEGVGIADFLISITDVTTGDSPFTTGTIGIGDPLFTGLTDSGTLTFSSSGGTTPIPEPSSLGLMLAGIGFLVMMRKRRSQDLPQTR